MKQKVGLVVFVAQRYFVAVEDYGGTVCPVRLTAAPEVLEQHVANESRIQVGKMATVEDLRSYFEKVTDTDQPIPGRSSFELDTGVLKPTEAARRIITHYGL